MPSESDKAEEAMCFVIMPFKEPFNEYYEDIIKPDVVEAQLVPKRADEILAPGVFMQDVVDGILSSKAIISELTERNPNVFYELGLAHGLAKPVIMITQDQEDVPSDLRALKWIKYTPNSHRSMIKLQQELTSTLKGVLEGNTNQTLMFPFILPKAEAPSKVWSNLLEITPKQKELLDFIRARNGPVHQLPIVWRFPTFSGSEMFYRLENLRLLGLLTSVEAELGPYDKQLYLYNLSHEARELLLRQRASTPAPRV